MDPELDQKLLASFADLAEAQVARSVLEAAGIPCRVDDLGQLPGVMLSELGSLGRSAGIWVLAGDLERAAAAIAEFRGAGSVDDAELEAQAMAEAFGPAAERDSHAAEGATAPESRFSRRSKAVALFWLVAGAALITGRCLAP